MGQNHKGHLFFQNLFLYFLTEFPSNHIKSPANKAMKDMATNAAPLLLQVMTGHSQAVTVALSEVMPTSNAETTPSLQTSTATPMESHKSKAVSHVV